MRKIIFRGKRVDNGEWAEGDLLQNIDAVKIREKEKYINRIARIHVCNPETVGQYTGLTDKNGKHIFEGDVVHCKSRWDNANMVVIFLSVDNSEWYFQKIIAVIKRTLVSMISIVLIKKLSEM